MRNIIMILLLLVTTGCKYSFDLNDSDMKPMVAVRAKICVDSTVVINVDKTVPLTMIDRMDTTLISPQYSLKCNGEEVETSFEMDGEGGMIIMSDSFKAGDKLEFVFSAEDMKPISTSTELPQPFPKYSLSLTGDESSKLITIAYEDDPDKTNYYGALVQWKAIVSDYYPNGETGEGKEVVDGNIYIPSDFGLNLDPGAYSPTVTPFNGCYLFFWSDEDEEDNIYELSYSYRYYGATVTDRQVRCLLFTLSEEMYRTSFAEYDLTYNPFSEIGLSSPSFTYSNIHNGLGHFCGYSVTPSQWIADPVEIILQ